MKTVTEMRKDRERAERAARRKLTLAAAPPPAEPAIADSLTYWAAVRPYARPSAAGRFYVDLSTLSASEESARRLADACDARNRAAIRRGEALPHARVARVEIREVRAG